MSPNDTSPSSPATVEPDGPLQLVLDGLPDAAVVVDEARGIRGFNAGYLELAGLRRRALIQAAAEGLRCCDVSGLQLESGVCLARLALEKQSPIRLDEIAARPRNGDELTVIVTAIPLRADRVLKIYRDVTADARIQSRYRELLDQARRANELLEERVDQRTHELQQANDELRRAQALLVHQEKMSGLGRLVAGVAHELNNPISFIYGNIEFMREYLTALIGFVDRVSQLAGPSEPLAAEIHRLRETMDFGFLREDAPKLLKSIRVGAERSAAIVRDLKLFSRNAPGRLEPADLEAGIRSTVNILAPVLRDRIAVRWDVEPLPAVRCNIGHLNQVFMNILNNAAEAMEDGGEILIRLRQRGEGVRILFRDSGPGIPAERMDKIFEPFFTTKEFGGGTGLGLAISDGIIRRHQGRLLVESEPGRGATFIVDLPVDPQVAED